MPVSSRILTVCAVVITAACVGAAAAPGTAQPTAPPPSPTAVPQQAVPPIDRVLCEDALERRRQMDVENIRNYQELARQPAQSAVLLAADSAISQTLKAATSDIKAYCR